MGDDAELRELEAEMGSGGDPVDPVDHGDHGDHHVTGAIATPEDGPTWSELTDSWDLFRDAIYAGGLAGAVLGFLSVYVVLRRMVFLSAAVTQAAGLGVALSFYAAIHLGFTIDPVMGATLLSLATAALLSRDFARWGLSREMILGMAFALASGAAVLVGSRITQEAHDVQSILFASFDPTAARVQRLPVGLLDLVLLLSIAVMIAQAARALGAMPAFAMSTLPGMAAILVARGPLVVPFVLAALFGAAAGVLGYLVAFFAEFPVGSSQTVVAVGLVVVAALARGIAALVVRLRRR
jgi:zinc transport system permease protein